MFRTRKYLASNAQICAQEQFYIFTLLQYQI
jgi:hypothetical protein